MLDTYSDITLIFIPVNVIIIFSYYLFLTHNKLISVSEKIISAVLLFSAQIILTELLLGNISSLTSVNLLFLNSAISICMISICIFKKVIHFSSLKKDISTVKSVLYKINSPYIIFLSLLILLVVLWLFLAAIMLPPRGIDDLSYHLPPVYEYIINQKIFLLPVEYRIHVAFPMNAELLFLWPTITFNNLNPIGLVQLFFGLFGILVVYALARNLSVSIKSSVLSGQIFFLSPIILTQSGVAYIDIIISVFFMVGVYFSLRFYITQKTIYLLLLGTSIGLLLGMKYSMILSFIIIQIFITPRLIKKSKRDIFIYLGLIFMGSAFWYIRNYLVVGDPIYPLLELLNTHGFISGYVLDISLVITKFKIILSSLFLHDIGIGSLHGGYGIVFWGIAFPGWIYFALKCIFGNNKNKNAELFIWSQIIFGFFLLFIVPQDLFHLVPRYSIFIVGFAAIAVGKLIDLYKDNKIYRNAIIVICCIFSFCSLFQMAKSKLPSYAVDIPVYDFINGNYYSKMRYLRIASTSMAFLWETLDYITLNHPNGLNTYFANSILDYAAPVYGSKLQNRVWNFQHDPSKPPEALLFLIEDEKNTRYYGEKITLDQATYNNDLQIVDIAEKAYLFLQKNYVRNNNVIKDSLIKHYNTYYKYEINSARDASKFIDKNIPIVTSSYFGIGFLYLGLIESTNNTIRIVPANEEESYVKLNNIHRFYTINSKIEGYRHKIYYNEKSNNSNFNIYLNY